jgi:hypothetical protein
LLKLALQSSVRPYAELANELSMSASEVHAAVRRSEIAGLIDPISRKPLRKPMEEYILHGLRYAFPAKRGPSVRGVPTRLLLLACPKSSTSVGRSRFGQILKAMCVDTRLNHCTSLRQPLLAGMQDFMNCSRWSMRCARARKGAEASRGRAETKIGLCPRRLMRSLR